MGRNWKPWTITEMARLARLRKSGIAWRDMPKAMATGRAWQTYMARYRALQRAAGEEPEKKTTKQKLMEAQWPDDLPDELGGSAVANILGVTLECLRKWRMKGVGPPWHLSAGMARYSGPGLLEWWKRQVGEE